MSQAIILFAHGARDPQWAEPFQILASKLSAQRPDCRVELAFLELMSPSLSECVAKLDADGLRLVTIVPAFMARGAHLRRDLPEMVTALLSQYPALQIDVTEALGEVGGIQSAMADWIAQRAH